MMHFKTVNSLFITCTLSWVWRLNLYRICIFRLTVLKIWRFVWIILLLVNKFTLLFLICLYFLLLLPDLRQSHILHLLFLYVTCIKFLFFCDFSTLARGLLLRFGVKLFHNLTDFLCLLSHYINTLSASFPFSEYLLASISWELMYSSKSVSYASFRSKSSSSRSESKLFSS